MAQVRKVLNGAADYDALPSREQALVRAAWLERAQALGAALNLRREFPAAGYRYAELDDRGAVTVREPRAPHRKRAKARRPGR